MNRFVGIITFIFFFFNHTNAQDTIQIISSDGVSTLSYNGNTTTLDTAENVIRLSLLTAFNGFSAVVYERKLSTKFSIEVMLGVTFRSIANDLDYVFSPYYFNKPVMAGVEDVFDNYANYDDFRRAKLGYCFGVTPKFYPNKRALKGFYIGPQINYKYFPFKVKSVQSYSTQDNSLIRGKVFNKKEFIHQLDFSLSLGRNIILKKNVCMTVNANLGTKYMIGHREDIVQNLSDVNQIRNYNKISPYFNVDFSIGGWF